MKKNRIRLTESQLHRVIKESVRKILKETSLADYYEDDYEEPSEDDIIQSLNGGPDVSHEHKKWQSDRSWDDYDKASRSMNDYRSVRANSMYKKANKMFSKESPLYRMFDKDETEDALNFIHNGVY